ncbi:SH3 domain-containing protein [Sphingomicrobium flavum]|uniref:SH3 domain-containing protein n=1 Tax=Sphingomicrobium flavum TaxID=1229164 RepID=UPI0021ADC047|nr:SH3 domain-containing protein [Sphingomicrobium flavum]
MTTSNHLSEKDVAPTASPTIGASQPSPIDREFPLAGTGTLLDPATHAYRGDLADVRLAGIVIASHYAAEVTREVKHATTLHSEQDGEEICRLEAGAPFALLDERGGWAWGYGGAQRRVGYVRVSALV